MTPVPAKPGVLSAQPKIGVIVISSVVAAIVAVILALVVLRLVNNRRGEIVFTAGMGDLFFHRPDAIAPPPDPNVVLSRHTLAWDTDGFRVPARQAASYDVLALGDSYTEGTNVALPWPDTLAAQSGLSVYNMGFRGYGPAEEARVLHDYGVKYKPRYVVLGFFEGNDLYDAVSVRWRGDFIPPSIQRQDLQTLGANYTAPTPHPPPYQFPVQVDLASGAHNMAFLDGYLSWVNGEYATYADSDNMAQLAKYLTDMQGTIKTQLPGTCLIMAYFPTSPHIYAPYIAPADRDRMLATVEEMQLPKPGDLIVGKVIPSTFADVLKRLNNQRDAVASLAKTQGVAFLDLTPAFQAAAAQGRVLYYTYDTHWNQDGQTLAGTTIAAALKNNTTTCSG